MNNKRDWPWVDKVILVLILIGTFLFYLKPPVDTDLGWHLRYGQEIFQNHSIFRDNQIGFFLPNYQWSHSYSLYQLISFWAYQSFDLGSLVILGAAILTLTVFLLVKNRSGWQQILIAGIFILAALPVTGLGYRSQLFSLLGVTFIYSILNWQKQEKNWLLFFLPIVFGLWANLHGGFILGLGLVGLIAIFQLLTKQFKKGLVALSILVACFLSTLVNPFGLKVYLEVYRHLWYPLSQLIAEWVPPGPTGVFTILTLTGFVIFLILVQNPKSFFKDKTKLFYFVSWVIFGFLAFKARRNLPIFGISSIFLIRQLIPSYYQPKKIFGLIGIGLSLLFVISQIRNTNRWRQNWLTVCQNSHWTLPCQAVDFLKPKTQICQKIFNAYEWGGYLSWHLPDRKIFVDGRMPAWPTSSGKSPYTIYLEILQAQAGYQTALDQFGADCLFIATGTFLDLELKRIPNSKWQPIFSDKVATIYQKQD